MKFTQKQFKRMAVGSPYGYIPDVLASAIMVTDEYIDIPNEVWIKLRMKYNKLQNATWGDAQLVSCFYGDRWSRKNIGDISCSPLDCFYVPFMTYLFQYGNCDVSHLAGKTIIFGGDGLFNKYGSEWFGSVVQKLQNKNCRLILWGAGSNYELKEDQTNPSWMQYFDVIGLRDFGNPWDYVPCPSCLRPEFDKPYSDPIHDVVIYDHVDSPVRTPVDKLVPRMNNWDNVTLGQVLSFLSSGKNIITTSFHGAYWGLLLGRKVFLHEPLSKKTSSFPISLTAVGDLPLDAYPAATSIPGYLQTCRKVNENFANKVFGFIHMQTPPYKTNNGSHIQTRVTKTTPTKPRHIEIVSKWAPGDILMATCAVRDLHKQYPGEFITTVKTTSMDIWKHNPYVKPTDINSFCGETKIVNLTPRTIIMNSNQHCEHYSTSYIQSLNEELKLKVRLTDLRPDIYFSDDERRKENLVMQSPYFVINAGGKSCNHVKLWSHSRWQKVVDIIRKHIPVVQTGEVGKSSIHKPLLGVTNLLGKTNFRQLMVICLHSSGGAGANSCLMHLMAAVNKPYVVIAGGREPWWSVAYTKQMWNLSTITLPANNFVEHRVLHTIGKLPCCMNGGCWKSYYDEDEGHKACLKCKDIVSEDDTLIGRCHTLIEPEVVAQAILDSLNNKPVEDYGFPYLLPSSIKPLLLE